LRFSLRHFSPTTHNNDGAKITKALASLVISSLYRMSESASASSSSWSSSASFDATTPPSAEGIKIHGTPSWGIGRRLSLSGPGQWYTLHELVCHGDDGCFVVPSMVVMAVSTLLTRSDSNGQPSRHSTLFENTRRKHCGTYYKNENKGKFVVAFWRDSNDAFFLRLISLTHFVCSSCC
jgi:hypothetical protein